MTVSEASTTIPLKTIPLEEINFHPTSFCDTDGRVFFWQGNLYRAIAPQYAPLCQKMFDTGIVRSLISQNFLIDTELTDLTVPGYEQVLKHRRLPFVSYANEWCPEMLREAAQFTLAMMRSLAPYGLTVDVGTWDILYEGTQPRYVDFCSIAAANTYDHNSWKGVCDDFYSYFVNPLRLMTTGYSHLARQLLSDYEHRVIHAELAALLGQTIYERRPAKTSLVKRTQERFEQVWFKVAVRQHPCRLDIVKRLERSLPKITPHTQTEPGKKEQQKLDSVQKIMSDLAPKTVLDVGCGKGDYARIAAEIGAQVVAIDSNDRQVARCYQMAQKEQLYILPLVMDIRYPSPGQGTGNRLIASAVDRLSCELVMALGILNQVVNEQHLTLPQAVEALASFAQRWLLVEFDLSATSASYELETFVQLLQRHFKSVEQIQGASNVLFLCDRKSP